MVGVVLLAGPSTLKSPSPCLLEAWKTGVTGLLEACQQGIEFRTCVLDPRQFNLMSGSLLTLVLT